VISPRAARQIAGFLKNGTFVEIPDAGHTPHEEKPGALATLISQFHASL
jgi:pimeloyl-ACP methyl ester carboxylesterase